MSHGITIQLFIRLRLVPPYSDQLDVLRAPKLMCETERSVSLLIHFAVLTIGLSILFPRHPATLVVTALGLALRATLFLGFTILPLIAVVSVLAAVGLLFAYREVFLCWRRGLSTRASHMGNRLRLASGCNHRLARACGLVHPPWGSNRTSSGEGKKSENLGDMHLGGVAERDLV